MITTAVILAAGKGTRFGAMTETKPKGFIEFKGKPMIVRSIENLISAGIKKIIIGTGYHREWYETLKEKYLQIVTVFSPDYAETNSMETLYQCHKAIGEDDFLLLESDIVYEPKALQLLIDDPHPDIMLVSDVMKFQDQYYITVDEEYNLLGCSTDENALIQKYGTKPYGELVGIHKISNAFYVRMVDDYGRNRSKYLKRGYEYEIEDMSLAALQVHEQVRMPVFVLKPETLQWYEIDDESDLRFAQENIQMS